MDKIIIKGGRALKGEVQVSGSKNSVLPLLCSTLLCEGAHVFHNVPRLSDVFLSCKILEHLGCEVKWIQPNTLQIKTKNLKSFKIPYELVSKMRASILFLAPILSVKKQVQVSFPGGCAIGVRPVDYHLKSIEQLGAKIIVNDGYIHAQCDQLKGAEINLEKPSVGATENILMAAVLSQGETIINNAAREPEIVDLICYLKTMGACIEGEGSSRISVKGVSELKPGEHKVISDRIEAATLLIAGLITQGEVSVRGCNPEHLTSFLSHLKESGFNFHIDSHSITNKVQTSWKAVDIQTGFFPHFPTDIQAQFMALMSLAEGDSTIKESVFENRFMHVLELNRLGAHIDFKGSYCLVHGVNQLQGSYVMATDLRASSSLVIAGLAAQGETVVQRIYHLDRGYEKLEQKLAQLGACISRVSS